MDTSVLTLHLFDLSYFIPLILLTVTLRARRFHCDPEGLIVGASVRLVFGGKPGGVMTLARLA